MTTYLGQIKRIPSVRGRVLKRHNLHFECPGWTVTILDVLEEIFSGVIWVDSRKLNSPLMSEILDSLIANEVKLHPMSFSFLVDPLESMGTIPVHMTMAIGNSSRRESNQNLHKKNHDYSKPIHSVQLQHSHTNSVSTPK